MSQIIERLAVALAKTLNPARVQSSAHLSWTFWALDIASSSLWVSPVAWDRTREVLVSLKGWSKLSWVVVTVIACFFSVATLAQGWKNAIFMGDDGEGEPKDTLRLSTELMLSLLSSAHLCFAFHALATCDTFPILLNRIVDLYRKFNDKYCFEDIEPTGDGLCCALILATLAFVTVSPLALVSVFLVRCDMSVASMLFSSTCEDQSHASVPLVPFWFLLQYGLLGVMAQIVLVYGCLGAVSLVLLNYIVDQLSVPLQESRLRPKYRNHHHQILLYRCLYLYIKHVDELGRFLLPADIAIVGGYFLVTSFHIIRLKLSLIHLVLGVLWILAVLNFLLMAFAATVCTKLAGLKERGCGCMTEAARGHQPETPVQSTYIKARYRSCAPIKLSIGGFTALNRHTPMIMIYRVVDTLVTLLCAFPSAARPLNEFNMNY